MTGDRYELIDFGDGRKLESLSGYRVDRPSPAATGIRQAHPNLWDQAEARFCSEEKQWVFRKPWPPGLDVDCGAFRMPLRPTPFGHIGLFPEQFDNWRWLGDVAKRIGRHRTGPTSTGSPNGPNSKRDLEGDVETWGLNLFGYTGASTLALVAQGLAVAHVDAAKPNVLACRHAAAHNGWADASIRYLVEDASRFVAREIRRTRRYHVVVLDPPAYGHGPRGKAWRLERDLWPLLDQCLELIDSPMAILVTGHSPQVDEAGVCDYFRHHPRLRPGFQSQRLTLHGGRSRLVDPRGRHLDAGFYVRLCSRDLELT